MTYLRYIITFVLLAIIGNVLAQNLHPTNVEVISGKRTNVSVMLDNPSNEYIMAEFWLKLPKGITIPVDEDGYYLAEGNSERFRRTHVIDVAEQEGNYHFLIYSTKNEAFKGSSGILFHFTLEADENVTEGIYQGMIINQLYNDIDKKEYTPKDVTFNIKVPTDGM